MSTEGSPGRLHRRATRPVVAGPVCSVGYHVMCSTPVNLTVAPSAKCSVPAASCDKVMLPSPWLTTCPEVKVVVQSAPGWNGADPPASWIVSTPLPLPPLTVSEP